MQYGLICPLIVAVVLGGLPLLCEDVDPAPGRSIKIAEVLANNRGLVADESNEFEDYVVLVNSTTKPIDVGGMYLTDDWNKPRQWQIPRGTKIEANGCLRIWADDQPSDGPMHACFKLRGRGEAVLLFDTDSRSNTLLDAVRFSAQAPDTPLRRRFLTN